MKTFLLLQFLDPLTLSHSLVANKRKGKADINFAAVRAQAASVRLSLK